jgi:hypothetical protein
MSGAHAAVGLWGALVRAGPSPRLSRRKRSSYNKGNSTENRTPPSMLSASIRPP